MLGTPPKKSRLRKEPAFYSLLTTEQLGARRVLVVDRRHHLLLQLRRNPGKTMIRARVVFRLLQYFLYALSARHEIAIDSDIPASQNLHFSHLPFVPHSVPRYYGPSPHRVNL